MTLQRGAKMNRIEMLLKQYGPMLSGNLAKIFEKKYNASNEAARKAISRARSPIQKIKYFPFEKNQVFCYLEEQYNTSNYKKALYSSLKNHSSTMSPLLVSLESNHGIISKSTFAIYSNSPIKKTKGHRLFSRNVTDLLTAEIIYEYDTEYYALNASYSGSTFDLMHSNSQNRICKIIISDFISWAAKINLIAYDSATIFPDIAEFSHFQWNATCPSYVQPIYNQSEQKPGFLVADVIYKDKVCISDIAYFIDKICIIQHFKNIPNFFPVLLVNNVESDALKLLKEHKIFVGILSNLYDNNYTSILSDIYNVFQNATAILLKDASKIDLLLENIAKNEGRFNNAMGDLFEYMVGSFYRKLGVSYIEMNKLIPNEKGTHNEIDILICKDSKMIIIECKATKSPLPFSYVQKWLCEIVPTFRKWLQNTYPQRKYEFQIWSLGGFDEQSTTLLKKHKETTTKYSLSYYSKSDILNIAKEYNDHIFAEQLKKHFSSY